MSLDPDALQQRLERALAGSRDGYWERDLRRNTSWYSPSFRAMLGFADDELPNDRNAVNARIHPDDLPRFLNRYERALVEGGRFDYEVRYRDAHDRWRWLRGRGQTWPGDDGRPAFITGAISDVTAEKEALQSLAALSRRFERAIEAADEGLFERVVGEPTTYVSDRLLELVGLTRADAPASRLPLATLHGLIHPDDRPQHQAVLAGAVRRLGRWTVRFRLQRGRVEYRWMRLRGVAERQADGRVMITGMLVDVHEQTVQRQALEQAQRQLEAVIHERTARLEAALALAGERRLEAERANAAKSRFLAHMSHEIRTPLNGVLGLIELARRQATEPDLQRYLDVAARSGQALLQVISDVLDFSRIEAGRIELDPQPLDLVALLGETLRGVMPLASQAGLLPLFDWTGGPGWVVGDARALRQIVTNLLGNAAKFTERGSIRLTGGCRALPDGRLQVEISVADTGPGIPPERREQVFDAFVQGDDSLGRGHGGTGLGLAIARSLSQAMGGQLTLACPPEGGTVFTLQVALPAAQGPATEPEPAAAPASGLVWLLGMTPGGAQWISRRLQRQGWRCLAFDDVDAALARLATAPPQVVLTSDIEGIDIAALSRLRQALPQVPVRLVIRPEWHRPAYAAQVRALGITLLTAPLTPTDIARLARDDLRAGTTDEAAEPAAPRWRAGAEVLLVEDNPVNQLIGAEFLRTLGLPARVVPDGESALRECQARPPALVLMDLQMPGLDGLQTARQLLALQRAGRWPGAPIVALTAHAGADDQAACLAAGMVAVLTKPLQLQTLRQTLARWLAD